MSDKFSKLTQNAIYCYKNCLLDDEVGMSMIAIYEAGVCDDVIANMFEKRVNKHKFQQAMFGPYIFKTPKLPKGNYIIGFDEKGKEHRSYIQFLNAHSLTVAGSGAGKTTFSYFKILQVAKHAADQNDKQVLGIWLFDLMKREFGLLKPYLSRLDIELLVLSGRDLKINPLQLPVGVEISNWIPRVADMLIEVLGLAPRASKLLQAKLFPLYRKFEGENLSPTLFDLFEEIKKDKKSNHAARTAILDSLEPVLLSLGPQVLAYRRGWTTEELASRHICFELAGLSETDKNLILNTLILSEFTSRIARGISNPNMSLWINLDEAQRICSASSHTSAIASLIGLVRGTGIGLDLSVQSIDKVLPQIVSNTATKVMGRCGSRGDYDGIGHSLGLKSDQIDWAQMNLEPGLFIGQLGEGQWRYPFVFKVPPMDLDRTVVDQRIDIGTLADIKTVSAAEFKTWGSVPVTTATVVKPSVFSSEQEYSFCKAVAEHPMQASSRYPKLAGISSKSAASVRQQLIFKGLIREHKLDSGGRGRSSLLLEILPEGIKAITEHQETQV